jgi:hypothetical protein
MKRLITVGACLAVALLASGVMAEEAFKSGPQPGSSKLPPFNPLHVTGKGAGGKQCLV